MVADGSRFYSLGEEILSDVIAAPSGVTKALSYSTSNQQHHSFNNIVTLQHYMQQIYPSYRSFLSNNTLDSEKLFCQT